MNRPLWFWREPSGETVAQFLEEVAQGKFSYAELGASRDDAVSPAGYVVDHNRVKLGEGTAVFEAACAELRAWRMFPTPWTMIFPAKAPIQTGALVAMQAHALGLWWLNACRVVYVIDEAGPVQRFGFAYGTLEAHVEQGEERFSVEQHADGSVWYDLRAFSRPRFWPVRLARPLARGLQRRFARESLAAMKKAVTTP